MSNFDICVWGTGNIAKNIVKKLNKNVNICAFIETNPQKDVFISHPVYSPIYLQNFAGQGNFVIVANDSASEVHMTCKNLGINEEQFIYIKNAREQYGYRDYKTIKQILGDINWADYCAEFHLYEESFVKDDIMQYITLNKRETFSYNPLIAKPVLGEKYGYGSNTGLYFWQDLWAARQIIKSGIKKHVDIGSRLDGFIAHLLAADISVTMIDIREIPFAIENLDVICADATNLNSIADQSLTSLSALCSLEHFGLGRYGDPIDPEACFKAFDSIRRVMRVGGMVYISVPVGKECLEFNAHRQFYASTIKDAFFDFELMEYSTCLENSIECDVPLDKYDDEYVHGNYRYGLFALRKVN